MQDLLERNMLSPDWHLGSDPAEVFDLIRTEEIASLDAEIPVERVKLIATDGATNYQRTMVDEMDDETFRKWMEYHFAICERQDLIGASHHTLDILRKKQAEGLQPAEGILIIDTERQTAKPTEQQEEKIGKSGMTRNMSSQWK